MVSEREKEKLARAVREPATMAGTKKGIGRVRSVQKGGEREREKGIEAAMAEKN